MILIYIKIKQFVLSKNCRKIVTVPISVLNTILYYEQKYLDVLPQGLARKTSEI